MCRDRRSVRLGLAAGLALTLVAAACGSDSSSGSSDTAGGGAESTAASGGSGGSAATGSGDEEVRLAVNPWTGSAVNANVAKAIIEKRGLGKVDLVVIDENAMWPAIAKGDSLDGVLEIWPSGHAGRLRDLHHRQEGDRRRRPARTRRQDRLVRAPVRGRRAP